MVIPNEGLIGAAPGFPEEVVVVPAEAPASPADASPVFVTDAWVGSAGSVGSVAVGTEVPCVELLGRSEWIGPVSDLSPRRILNPLELFDVWPTSPGQMNIVITMTTTANT